MKFLSFALFAVSLFGAAALEGYQGPVMYSVLSETYTKPEDIVIEIDGGTIIYRDTNGDTIDSYDILNLEPYSDELTSTINYYIGKFNDPDPNSFFADTFTEAASEY
jgi:hypothetical protein